MKRNLLKSSWCLALALVAGQVFAQDPKAPEQAAKLDFDQFTVDIKPFGAAPNVQVEHLKFESKGVCWYRNDGYSAVRDIPARNGGVFSHTLSQARINRLNKLLKETQWLEAAGGEGRALQLHAGTMTLTLTRGGKQKTLVCEGERPAPYAALLHELLGICAQERKIYLHDYVSGDAGRDAWQEVGRELAAIRGEPYSKSLYEIEYERYLPIARRIIRDFHSQSDDELVTAIRLIGYLKSKSELSFLHRLADDRSMKIRGEIAQALGMIHDKNSLPVLVSMMPASGTGSEVALELIRWGNDAVPDIVRLIGQSTDASLDNHDRTAGENMIRAYIENFAKAKPIDPAIVAAVRQALATKDPMNGLIRITYHNEFLKLIPQ